VRERIAACAALLIAGALITACGSGGASSISVATRTAGASGAASASQGASTARSPIPDGDWTRFDYDSARSGVGPADTGITARNLSTLQLRRVRVDGTVDSSPIELHGITVNGRRHDLIVVTTTYGRTIGIDAGTGRRLWEFVPRDIGRYEGTYQITTATPVADPSRRWVFAASPDGVIHKLAVSTGREVRARHWPARVTLDGTHEKIASALNLNGREVIVATGGYVGDIPPYQGHVVTLDRATGRIFHVWNSLCAHQHRLLVPRSCPDSDSAIWSRAGAVVEPGSGRLLVSTGNAARTDSDPFNGSTYWSDSVLELSPDAARLLHNWTPSNQAQLSVSDGDIGSTAPALLPPAGGFRLAVQGGKDAQLHLLDLNRLDGTTGPAASRLGGELQDLPTPGHAQLFSAPAVWAHNGRTYVIVADDAGTGEYTLTGTRRPRLQSIAQNGSPGTSPIIAGGLLYIYDHIDGRLRIYDPAGLQPVGSLPAARGHWNSPIALAGRVIVPEGNANDHAASGTIDIYHLPGR
jgi:hypothetical protein